MKYALRTFEKLNYQEFDKTFIKIFIKQAPMKKMLVRTNQALF